MKKLRGGHIILAAVPTIQKKSRATVITFKKVTRTGRKPTFKIQKHSASDQDITPTLTDSQPPNVLLDEDFFNLYQDEIQDSRQDCIQALWEEEDVNLPRRATVS